MTTPHESPEMTRHQRLEHYEPMTMPEALPALQAAYDDIDRVVETLDARDFLKPTLCTAWTVGDLVFHLLLDSQRALTALATPSQAAPDVDFVTYWRPWSAATDDAIAHARFVRVAASAYATPRSLVDHRRTTAEAALRAAAAADPGANIATQGHSLAVPDFLATLAVEAAVHHLDLVAFVDGALGPHPAPLAVVRRTLDGLAGGRLDVDWDDTAYALKGTGRAALTNEDRRQLGTAADALPLFS